MMTTLFSRWRSRRSVWQFLPSLILPLLLLLTQQGALLHELTHIAGNVQQEEGQRSSKEKPCDLCVSFAQTASIATQDVAAPGLLAGLSFLQVPAHAVADGSTERPAPRSRGPPRVL
jgi:hypothetical protein